MSTYNETHSHLSQAIESIINQTYKNIEFIIVLDNPENKEILNTLKLYKSKDSRIKVIKNDINLGLAKSLNLAIDISSGKYIARMDADDISFLDRLEKQIMYLEKNQNCSVVSSDRVDIDEFGNEKQSNYKVIKGFDNIKYVLASGSVINHPSVMIRKTVLEKVGGYRNFEVSQDYDLWLRLIILGYEINIMNEKLIYYRIRTNSITSGNPFKQYLFSNYARKMFIQRKKGGKDEFCNEKLNKYLIKNGYFNNDILQSFNKAYIILFDGIKLCLNNNIHQGILKIFNAFIKDPKMIKVFYNALVFKHKIRKVY